MSIGFLTIAKYVLAVAVAIPSVILISFLSVLPFASGGGPGAGILWFIVFVAEATLLIPISLGLTAEWIERRAQKRSFKWSRALGRSAGLLPAMLAPLYWMTSVAPFVDSRRPPHWVAKECILCLITVAFLYLSLRLRVARNNTAFP